MKSNSSDFYKASMMLLIIFLLPSKLLSQEIEPRAYANLPVGSNFGVLNYSFTSGNIISDPVSPVKSLEIDANNLTAGYVRTFDLFGKLSRIQILQTFTFLSGTAKLAGKDTSGSRTGFADTRIRFGINLLGSPALSPKEFVSYKDGTTFGASLVVTIPTGQYFEERLINLGTNRWGIKPEIGISQRFSNFYGELYSGIWFFTKNNEYLTDKTLSVEPVFNFQGQVNYIFKKNIWLGFNTAFSTGGETKVDGVSSDTQQDNWRFGGVFAMPLSRNFAMKIQYHTGAVVRRGSDFDFYGLTLQYFWI